MTFKTLWVSFPAGSSVEPEFVTAIGYLPDVTLVQPPTPADAHLEVLQEAREKEIVAFSSTGRPREFELRLRFRFRVLDEQADEWVPTTEILLRRTVTSTDAQLGAKAQEEVFLYRDMTSDLVQQLMWRLAALRR
jgi:LPS-assembly lipoprotein